MVPCEWGGLGGWWFTVLCRVAWERVFMMDRIGVSVFRALMRDSPPFPGGSGCLLCLGSLFTVFRVFASVAGRR